MEKMEYFLKNFLQGYAEKKGLRMHMPGHKGRCDNPELNAAYQWDITEIAGADSLFEAEGILRQGEKQTAEIYQTPACCWSAGGSTLCIQAMLTQMKAENRVVIAARTVHRAFLNSCVLLDLHVKWIFPRTGGVIAGKYDPADFEKALQETKDPACVYVTSPDYAGNLQDIRALAEICRKYGARLLVDNAHGAHLAFLRENLHPIALGADYCCDSAHKTLSALTGGAFLHMRDPERVQDMKRHMQLFGSTSPNYLILESLEACTGWLWEHGEEIRKCEENIEKLRKRLEGKYQLQGKDPMHLTIAANGILLADALRKFSIECEYADKTCLVLLLSPMMTEQEFAELEMILLACEAKPAEEIPALPPPMKQEYGIREAALSDSIGTGRRANLCPSTGILSASSADCCQWGEIHKRMVAADGVL